MLTLNHVSKSYNGKIVVNDVQLTIPSGETHILLGSSGSGKSTLLKMVMGLLPPDLGSITLLSQVLGDTPEAAWVQQIGYVPQDGGLFPHLTAKENVTLVAQALGWSKEKIATRLEDLRRIVALPSEFLDRYPRELSGGQRQRASLMRAGFLDPCLLLLDEPLAALDPILRREVQRELADIFHRLRKTVIFVTHDIGEAAFLGGRVSLMKSGRIVQTGTLDELLEKPADPFVSQFINAQRDWRTQ